MKNESNKNIQRSAWEKIKDGVSSFFFEPIPETGGTQMPEQSKQEATQKPTANAAGNTREPFRRKTNSAAESGRAKDFLSPAHSAPVAKPSVNTQTEEAYIPKDTVIEGNIVTNSDIHIAGIVNGDVTTEGQITLSGKIVGDISANTLTLNTGSISGDIVCRAGVTLANEAIVNGNIDAQSLDCNGEVHGDVKTAKTVVLRSNSLICGNVITKTINMQDGAVLQGHVEMPADKTSAQIYFKNNNVENA